VKKLLIAVLVCGVALAAQGDLILAWDVQGHGNRRTPRWGPAQLRRISTRAADSTHSRAKAQPEPTRPTRSTARTGTSRRTFNSGNNYISFSLDASPGYEVQLTSLDYAINGSNTGPRNGRWGYTTDSGANWTYQTDFTVLNPAATSLSTWDFPDFTTSGLVEFRYWAYGTQSVGGTAAAATGGTDRIGNINGNDLVLNGTVIPEPTTIALLILGVTGLRIFARRRNA